ncbi:pimeloyl-ACP methyl ester carboxylesterase [Stenotrophomonas rhizophila]
MAGIEPEACVRQASSCVERLISIRGTGDDRVLAASAELWVVVSQQYARKGEEGRSEQLDALLHAARYAYAYLFFGSQRADQRVFESRQSQVRDYYNYSVRGISELVFQMQQEHCGPSGQADVCRVEDGQQVSLGDWVMRINLSDVQGRGRAEEVEQIRPAQALDFKGLRSNYGRDGLGAPLVGMRRVTQDEKKRATSEAAFSAVPFIAASMLIRFDGHTLDQVLSSRALEIAPLDPYDKATVEIQGETVPLAANFTAPYGLWLAESGFAKQSLKSLAGRAPALNRAHIYLMQPYDPERRVVVLLHGLASSPEAWVNVANEIMGDEALRRHFQIWQVYYPTNLPIPVNRRDIELAIRSTIAHYDPAGLMPASQDMVLVGHSMGGVIARLLVSSSGSDMVQSMLDGRHLPEGAMTRIRQRLEPMVTFEPMPQVDRAIFIASPHRGAPMANGRLGRIIGRLVRLPSNLLLDFAEIVKDLNDPGLPAPEHLRVPNSIESLSDKNPFVRAAADLKISPHVRYHTIVGKHDGASLALSSDGVVPYTSAHLENAASETVIESNHSVQEKAEAILEIRRILKSAIAEP